MTAVRRASSGRWERIVHCEPVWGTVVSIEIRGAHMAQQSAAQALAAAAACAHEVDAHFSTFRADSVVSALRTGTLTLADTPPAVQEVWRACEYTKWLTRGAFDSWATPGGFDPSGLVKGWAADRMAELVVDAGFPNVTVNAAGDVTCRGEQAPGVPWIVGIRDPRSAGDIVRTVGVSAAAVATSGNYERGEHIINPHHYDAVAKLDSATVIGPDGALADALATALVIVGNAGVEFFTDLPGWSGYLIAGTDVSYFGPAFA